jgi:hypothetical protein
MDELRIVTSVLWIDLIFLLISKSGKFGNVVKKWYKEFGITAVFSDCLIIILGIYIALYLFPNSSTFELIVYAIMIQIIHDILLYYFIILPLPLNTNKIIDIFKEYALENSYKPIIADSTMIGSSVLLYKYLEYMNKDLVSFLGFLGFYLITYALY